MAIKLEQKVTQSVTRTANADLANAYRFVVEGADPAKIDVAGANVDALGVIETTYKAGDAVRVLIGGILLVEAGAAVNPKDLIVTDASGRAVAKGSTASTHYKVQGRALSAATGAGQLIAFQVAKQDFYQA